MPTVPSKNTKAVLLLILSFSVPVFSADDTSKSMSSKVMASGPRPVAVFSGTTITEDDLRLAAAADLDKLRIQAQQIRANLAREEQQILENNLLRLLADKIFEAEASKRGITKEALLQQELKGKIKEPTRQDISAFYQANRQRFQKPLDQVSDEIRQYLRTEYLSKATGDLADRLKAGYEVKMLLPPLRVHVKTDGAPSRGPKEAPVTIVEFSDFQSPQSARLNKTLDEAMTRYGNKVRLVYLQFPLSPIHPFAEQAAEASLCAADQNQFWEMRDSILGTPSELKMSDLKAKASKLKLDMVSFESCLRTGKYAQRVQQDQREGYMLGVSVPPALFVNGRYMAGTVSPSDLSRVVDEEIRFNALKTAAAAETHRDGTSPAAQTP